MQKPVKIIAGLVAVVVILFAALAIFVSTLNADKYRPQIVAEISKQTGRTVKLAGPISFSLGLSGVKISVQDASIGNPSWASRPQMAGMGKFTVGVGLLPLLAHRISVNELTVENADILLETNAAGQHNWDFGAAPQQAKAQAAAKPATSANPAVGISVDKLSVVNSRLAMRDATGKISAYNVSSLTLGMHGAGAEVKFKGDANGTPITADVKTSLSDLMGKGPFSFDADLAYAAFHVTAKGTVDQSSSKAEITEYRIESGKSSLGGKLNAAWGGARPSVKGTLTSDHFDPADFKSKEQAQADAASAGTGKAGPKRIFSDAPLPLDGLKAADADIVASIAELPMGKSALKQVTAKLDLTGGRLTLAPVKATLGATPIDVQVKLDASQSPAQLTVGIKASGVDLGDLQKLGNMAPFMTGKAGADIELAGSGNSEHAIASSLGGIVTITAEKGEILTGAAADVSNLLAKLLNPGGGNAALNCLAARFTAKNGVLTDNGILIDSVPSTVSGKGNINLGVETMNLVLHAKTKLVDIGGLVPPLDINGSLSDPGYSIAATAVVGNVVNSLMKGNIDVIDSGVPDIQTPPAGQNACVYTLDHPKAAASSTVLPSTLGGKASQQIQNLGGSLVKGLFGQ